MNDTTTTTLLITTTTAPSIWNPMWQLYLFTFDLIQYNFVGLFLELIILIISLMKKRQPEQTYRVIILYQLFAAMLYDCIFIISDLYFGIFTFRFTYINVSIFWRDFINDLTGRSQWIAEISLVLLTAIFSINRFLAVNHPITFSIHMTTRRVHIYCISILALVTLFEIIDEIDFHTTKYLKPNLFSTLLLTISAFVEVLITPITSIWVMAKLLLHLRVLKNLKDNKGIIEFIFISFALLVLSIFDIAAILPNAILYFYETFFNGFWYDAYDPTNDWLYNLYASWITTGSQIYINWLTISYSLTILVNVRVYAEVWWQIPMIIYRFGRKHTSKVISIVKEPKSTNNSKVVASSAVATASTNAPSSTKWAERVNIPLPDVE